MNDDDQSAMIGYIRDQLDLPHETRETYDAVTGGMVDLAAYTLCLDVEKILDRVFAKPEEKLPSMPQEAAEIPSLLSNGITLCVVSIGSSTHGDLARLTVKYSNGEGRDVTASRVTVSRRALLEALGWTGEKP